MTILRDVLKIDLSGLSPWLVKGKEGNRIEQGEPQTSARVWQGLNQPTRVICVGWKGQALLICCLGASRELCGLGLKDEALHVETAI